MAKASTSVKKTEEKVGLSRPKRMGQSSPRPLRRKKGGNENMSDIPPPSDGISEPSEPDPSGN